MNIFTGCKTRRFTVYLGCKNHNHAILRLPFLGRKKNRRAAQRPRMWFCKYLPTIPGGSPEWSGSTQPSGLNLPPHLLHRSRPGGAHGTLDAREWCSSANISVGKNNAICSISQLSPFLQMVCLCLPFSVLGGLWPTRPCHPCPSSSRCRAVRNMPKGLRWGLGRVPDNEITGAVPDDSWCIWLTGVPIFSLKSIEIID